MSYEIRLLGDDELALWTAGLRAQLPHNGRDGRYFSTLLEADADQRFTPERLAAARASHKTPVGTADWLRVFGAWLGPDLVGHADLKSSGASAGHRCTLGIGLLAEHQGQRLGLRLMQTAIAWARDQGLAWMDLGVFLGNDRAVALYRKLGFVEVGRVPDRYRIGDTLVTEIIMTLALT